MESYDGMVCEVLLDSISRSEFRISRNSVFMELQYERKFLGSGGNLSCLVPELLELVPRCCTLRNRICSSSIRLELIESRLIAIEESHRTY